MNYEFKRGLELLWFVAVAVVAFVAQTMLAADFEEVAADPQAWGLALASGAARAAVVALGNGIVLLWGGVKGFVSSLLTSNRS